MGRAGCGSGEQSSVKLLATCLLMVGAEFPTCWLFGLKRPAVELTGSLVGLMVDSRRAHTKEYFSELLLPVPLSLQ